MNKKYDVLIIEAGPAVLYTSIIFKKGTPMKVDVNPKIRTLYISY